MPIDERLHAALRHNPEGSPSGDPDVLDAIVGRVTRRHQVRVAAVGAAAAVAALAFVMGPSLLSQRADGPTDHGDQRRLFTLAPQSPVENRWSPILPATEHDALAALRGTPFSGRSGRIAARLFAGTTPGIDLDAGTVLIDLYDIPTHTSHSLSGTYALLGRTLTLRLDGIPGTTTLAWHIAALSERDHIVDGVHIRASHRLDLTMKDTTVTGKVFHAPAAAFFRILAARTFYSTVD